MRRFEIHAPNADGDPFVAGQGCQFDSGLVAMCWTENPYIITELSSTLIAFMDRSLPGTVVWIDKANLAPLPAEEAAGKHAVETTEEAQAIVHLTTEVWDGAPLP
jgi:hypothetical protein